MGSHGGGGTSMNILFIITISYKMHAPRHWLKYWLKKKLVFSFHGNSKEVACKAGLSPGPMWEK
jgi:hypothetical protein